MKKKSVIIYLITLLISMCLSSVVMAETHENRELYHIKEVVAFDEVKTDNDMDIKLFGITDEHFKYFMSEFQQDNYNYIFNNKNIKRYIKTDKEKVDLNIKLNYINKNIEEDHSNNLNKIHALMKDTPVTIEFLANGEAIIWCNEININEYILEHGFAAVNEKDEQVSSELIKKYNQLQQKAVESECGIWGTTFSESVVTSVPIRSDANAPIIVHVRILLAIAFMLLIIFISHLYIRKFFEKRINKFITYLCSVTFWMMGIFIALILAFYYPFDYKIYWGIIVILILGIIYYCQCIIKYIKNMSIYYLMVNTFGIVTSIITIFAITYFTFSCNELRVKDFYYKYPSFEFAVQEVVENPYENYIHIPIENYKIEQINHIDIHEYDFSIIDALYFSSTTYFTVGYGDYYPCGILRIVSTFEMYFAFFLNLTVLGVAISKYFGSNDDDCIIKKHRNRRHIYNKYKRKLRFRNH